VTIWPSSVISFTPRSASCSHSRTMSSIGRERSSPRVFGTMQKAQSMLQPCWMETKAETCRSSSTWSRMVFCEPASSAMSTMVEPMGTPAALRGAEVVEVVGHLVEFLRADDEVDVGQAVEQGGAAVLRHAAEDAEDEVRLLFLAGGEVPALPMAFCSAASRTLQVLSSMMSQLSSLRHDAVAPAAQHRRDRLAVALVHLAAVGFDVDPVHSSRRGAKADGSNYPPTPPGQRGKPPRRPPSLPPGAGPGKLWPVNPFHRLFLSCWLFGCMAGAVCLAAAAPEALLVIAGDQHSAYERTAQVVATVDRLKAEHPGLPLAILLNGDTLEYGNVVARRSAGAVDFAMFAALARRAPTIVNVGNHEPEFYDLTETIARLRATGVTVVCNITNRATGQPFCPAVAKLRLGGDEFTVVGVTTDNLATYRVAVRPALDLADPVVWAQRNFPTLLAGGAPAIVLSHAGIKADRGLMPLVPAGTLFAGAHDHQRFIHPFAHGLYVHSGSWNEYLTLAWLHRDEAGRPPLDAGANPVPADGRADPNWPRSSRKPARNT
jgi:hypothetical protein